MAPCAGRPRPREDGQGLQGVPEQRAPVGQCPIPKAHPLHSWIQMLLPVWHRIPLAPKQDPHPQLLWSHIWVTAPSPDTAQLEQDLQRGQKGEQREQQGDTSSVPLFDTHNLTYSVLPSKPKQLFASKPCLEEPVNSPVLALRDMSRDGPSESDAAGKLEHFRSFLEHLAVLHTWCISRAPSTPAFPISGKENRPLTTQKHIHL